jgi:hypothetical protein
MAQEQTPQATLRRLESTPGSVDMSDTQSSYSDVSTLSTSIGIGAGIVSLNIVEKCCSINRTYTSDVHAINRLELQQSTVLTEVARHRSNASPVSESPAMSRVNIYSREIAQAKADLPIGYHPHVEAAFDIGSFTLTALCVGSAVYKAMQHRARNHVTR